jgi:2-methylcitrate dehydratase
LFNREGAVGASSNETITAQLARWAAGFGFEQLPETTVHQAKRFLLDSLACALGGRGQPDVQAMEGLLDEVAGPGPCALLGSGKRVDPLSAALGNALLVRVLDYNDIYWQQDPSHPSDLIPAALACCERSGRGGQELAVGIVLGHELEMRLCEAAEPGIRERGWHHATLTGFAAPVVAARMLGLDADQIQHAIGISGSRSATLGAVTAGRLTMMKNTVDPLATQSGVLAALLAERGYTGPEHVLEGKEGLVHCLGPGWRLELLTEDLGRPPFRIERCGMKAFPTEALTHAPISAVLSLVREYDLQPEQVRSVRVRSLARAADILADPSKYDPRSKETADHSLPYCIAVALVDRQVTPRQFAADKIADPRIRAQLEKVEVLADPEIEALFPGLQRVHVSIETADGRTLQQQLDYPRGDPRNPLTDAEIEEKFAALAAPLLSAERRKQVVDAVWRLERLERVSDLMDLLAADLPVGPAHGET